MAMEEEDKEEVLTEQNNDDSQRGLCPSQMRPAAAAGMDLNNESQKHLLTNMLNRSVFNNDMDNSRNDVVPQRTLIEEPFASIHPEGIDQDNSKSSLSSISASSQHSEVKAGRGSHGDELGEDNEASPLHFGKGKQQKQLNAAPSIGGNNCELKIVLQ